MEEPNIVEQDPSSDYNGQTADKTEEVPVEIIKNDEVIPEVPGEIKKNDEMIPEVPMEIIKNDEVTPARLTIRGFDEENEEIIRLTVEEARNYILSEVETKLRDSQINPLLKLKNKIETVKDTIEEQLKEINMLKEMFDVLCNNQEKYLRLTGLFPTVEKRAIGVSVDLPFLPESYSNLSDEDILDQTGNTEVVIEPTTKASSSVPKNISNKLIECIDLTNDADDPSPSNSISATTESIAELAATPSSAVSSFASSSTHGQTHCITSTGKPLQHPAPLPFVPDGPDVSSVLPKPRLKISVDKNGIVLQWSLPPEAEDIKIMGFEIFGYQEKNNVPISSALWKRIGCVDPLPLPMSCTLTQFMEGFNYHFSVRAVNKDNNFGHFSDPATIKMCFK